MPIIENHASLIQTFIICFQLAHLTSYPHINLYSSSTIHSSYFHFSSYPHPALFLTVLYYVTYFSIIIIMFPHHFHLVRPYYHTKPTTQPIQKTIQFPFPTSPAITKHFQYYQTRTLIILLLQEKLLSYIPN